jgi:hypothetical protein
MTVPPDILDNALLSTLKLEQAVSARLTQQLADARELLRQVAADLRASGMNRLMAERIEAHLAQPTPTTTQGGV